MSYSSENISLIRAKSDISDFLSGKVNDLEIEPFANLFYPYLVDNGGSSTIVSLTIDILNKKDLDGNGFVNKEWLNPDRLRGFLPEAKPLWGFQETHHSTKTSRAISNAFCFSGQKLSFYIAPQGEGTGYVDGRWIYCKTTITVSALDVIKGIYTPLKSFSNFAIDKDDSSRYFSWQIPEQYDEALSKFGLFGLFVIRIDIENSYYSDAEFHKPITTSYLQKNQALLQLLTYSGANELVNVPSPVEILKSPITGTETLEDIFAHTIFDDLKEITGSYGRKTIFYGRRTSLY